MADLTNVALTVDINFTAHVGGDKNAELKHHQATVVFSSIEALLERGGESVKRILQTQARSEDGFPTGRRVIVNEKGKFEPTKEEKEAAAVAAVLEIDDDTQNAVARIMRDHPKLVDTTKGRSGADPFVIALATTVNPMMTVVTEEAPGKSRIPDVCTAQGIKYCGVADLIEKEDWRSGK